jgi:proteic killer suppression protein
MIQNIRHKGLRRFYEKGDSRLLSQVKVDRIHMILSALDEAHTIADMNHPSLRLHALKGDLKGYCSVSVSANWRIIFRFENGKALDVDLVDYH